MFRWSDLLGLLPRHRADGSSNGAKSAVRLLAITSSDEFYARLVDIASSSGWEIRHASTVSEGLAVLRSTAIPLILFDWDETGEDWRSGFSRFASGPNRPCILLASRFADDNLRQEVMRLRGYDVLSRSADPEQIVRAVEFAWSWTTWSQRFAGDAKQEVHKEPHGH
jgi:DNA-binding NarL/FixJ family response regulator